MHDPKVPAALSPWVCRLVRLGYLAKGVIYLFIGVLAVRLALGIRGGQLTDASGVLLKLLHQPFGRLMLAVIGVGIVAYAAYYLFEAIADLRHRGGGVARLARPLDDHDQGDGLRDDRRRGAQHRVAWRTTPAATRKITRAW